MKKVLYILGELDDSDIEWLIHVGTKERVPAEGVLIQENVPIHALYIVIEGSFSIRSLALDNEEIAQVGAGEILGEMSYVDSRPPAATVVALNESLVLSIPRQVLSEKLEQDLGFAAHFYRALSIFLAGRLRASVSQLGFGEADESQMEEDELDLDQLDSASMGGARFDQILKRLKEV